MGDAKKKGDRMRRKLILLMAAALLLEIGRAHV